MSDNNFDSAKEGFDSAKESAKETFNDVKDGISDAADATTESVKDFGREFKSTVTNNQDNKKVVAGILGILVGALGIHKFVLGYKKEGLIMLLGTILTCGIAGAVFSIIGLVEGIIYLTKSDEEFYQTYQVGEKTWF